MYMCILIELFIVLVHRVDEQMDGGGWTDGWMEQNLGAEVLSQSLVLLDTASFPKWLYRLPLPLGKLFESSSCFSSSQLLFYAY